MLLNARLLFVERAFIFVVERTFVLFERAFILLLNARLFVLFERALISLLNARFLFERAFICVFERICLNARSFLF